MSIERYYRHEAWEHYQRNINDPELAERSYGRGNIFAALAAAVALLLLALGLAFWVPHKQIVDLRCDQQGVHLISTKADAARALIYEGKQTAGVKLRLESRQVGPEGRTVFVYSVDGMPQSKCPFTGRRSASAIIE